MAFVFSSLTYNLSEFVLHYKADFKSESAPDAVVGPTAVPAHPLNGYYTFPFADIVPIQTVELKGQNTGETLWRLNNASPYLTLMAKLGAAKDQFLSRTKFDANRPARGAANVL